jgi:hypothetical protein
MVVFAEEPGADVLGHFAQSFVGDALAVNVRDVIAPGVPHNATNRQEVARLVADRLEGVAKAVEIPVAIDAQRVEQLPYFVR